VVHEGAHQDDDAIEEQNAARSSWEIRDRNAAGDRSRSTGRHSSGTTTSAPSPTRATHRADGAERSGAERSGVEKSGVGKSGVEKSGVEKSGADKSDAERPDHRAKSGSGRHFDPHDGYLRLSRALAGAGSGR